MEHRGLFRYGLVIQHFIMYGWWWWWFGVLDVRVGYENYIEKSEV